MDNKGGTQKMKVTAMNVQGPTSAKIEKEYKRLAKLKNPRSGATWQRVKETKGEGYDRYIEQHGRRDPDGNLMETREANPDELAPTLDVFTQTRNDDAKNEVVARVRQMMDLAKQILTEQQYNVFILTMVKDPMLTLREAGKVLGISFGRVRQLSDTAKAKLTRAYDERTH